MKKLISNRLSMYGSVLSTLNSNQSAWNNVPAFAEAVAQFTQKLADFRTAAINEDSVRDGVRATRDVSLNELKGLLATTVRAMQLIGLQTGSSFLTERYDITPSAISNLSFRKLEVICVHLDEDWPQYSTELTQLGLDAEAFTHYTHLRDQLLDLTNVVRDSIIRHAGVLDDIKARNNELMALLKQIDKMVYIRRDAQPQFAKAYLMSRKSWKYGTHHSPPDTNTAA